MNKLTKKEIQRIEKETSFSVSEYDDYYSFGWYSNAGEDFSFEIQKGKREEIIQEIKDYAFEFNPEEHASLWYGANRGEPSSLRVLLNDADEIAEKLDELAKVVSSF